MKVKQFHHANQLVLEDESAIYFQSYDSVICRVDKRSHKVTLDKNNWDYSNTTRKHLYLFIKEYVATCKQITKINIETVRELIANKTFQLADLN